MSLQSPLYIPVDIISQPNVKHVWDDQNPYEPVGPPDEGTMAVLEKVSNRGVTAFAVGCAEWIVYRFARLSSDKTPFYFLESCWVLIMGNDYVQPSSLKASEWKGPIRGAIDLALLTIVNVWNMSEGGSGHPDGAFAAKIALHVVEHKPQFLEWQEKVLQRLIDCHPRDEEDLDGPAIPREILDPSVDFGSVSGKQLIKDFLSKVDYKSNPFLKNLKPNGFIDSE